MTPQEHIDRLDQRCRWLTARIAAKESIGWSVEYDCSERDALAWALPRLRQQHEQQHDVSGAISAGCLGGD